MKRSSIRQLEQFKPEINLVKGLVDACRKFATSWHHESAESTKASTAKTTPDLKNKRAAKPPVTKTEPVHAPV